MPDTAGLATDLAMEEARNDPSLRGHVAKNQSHLALAKFAEGEKYAPNWGRLHLKWGEALAYAGRKDDAKAQFARSAQLDLTPLEKSELNAMNLLAESRS